LIDGVEANQLQRGFSSKRLDRLFKYLERITGIAAKGYVHHLAKHSRENYVTNGNHINDLEVFWGYLKRKLVKKMVLGSHGCICISENMSGDLPPSSKFKRARKLLNKIVKEVYKVVN
jgi:hypothetical protein